MENPQTQAMANQAYGPTVPLSTGTMTRKPLPKIEASGVAVALKNFFVFSFIDPFPFRRIVELAA